MATLVAFACTLEASAQDDALDVLDRLLTDLLARVDKQERQRRLRTIGDLDTAALLLRDISLVVPDRATSGGVAVAARLLARSGPIWMRSLRERRASIQPELALGAVTADGARFLNSALARELALRPSPLMAAGTRVREHEFHWSLAGSAPQRLAAHCVIGEERVEGFCDEATVGSYVQLNVAGAPGIARRFVQMCASSRQSTGADSVG